MQQWKRKIALLGYGTIGKCVLDLLLLDRSYIERESKKWNVAIDMFSYEYYIIDCQFTENFTTPRHLADLDVTIKFIPFKLKKDNLCLLFADIGLTKGDIVIDLTNGTDTRLLVKIIAAKFGSCYVGTALEGWHGYMYPMPEMVSYISLLKKYLPSGTPTVMLTHGMNPGMVSHFAIEAMKHLTEKEKRGITKIHITEIDTQKFTGSGGKPVVAVPKLTVNRPRMAKNILSTWGPQNFVDEMNACPFYVKSGRSTKGNRRAYRIFTPSIIYDPEKKGLISFTGNIVTHEEAFTINNYVKKTIPDAKPEVAFIYRPTEPSFQSFVKEGRPMKQGERKGLLIKGPGVKGYDTVGIYIENSETEKKVWVGNSCSAGFAANKEVKKQYHNATTMQVAAGVMGALCVIWSNEKLGLRFPEEVPEKLRKRLLQFTERYYGKIVTKVW